MCLSLLWTGSSLTTETVSPSFLPLRCTATVSLLEDVQEMCVCVCICMLLNQVGGKVMGIDNEVDCNLSNLVPGKHSKYIVIFIRNEN